MIQFLADCIDQLDLALDQLAVRHRNFDRFALMLIDNVVELTMHRFAADRAHEGDRWNTNEEVQFDRRLIQEALGQAFDKKARAVSKLGLMDTEVCEAILSLHSFRNTAYHRGLRHEGILHSLAILYFCNACRLLTAYETPWWSWSPSEEISHRAKKYLGNPRLGGDTRTVFRDAFTRLQEVVKSIPERLVEELSNDMAKTIDEIDESIQLLANDGAQKRTRDQVIVDSQVWPLAFSDKGKSFLSQSGCPEATVFGCVEWLAKHYPLTISSDPISTWRARLQSLQHETDDHKGLAKYCNFMQQTETLRARIDDAALQLNVAIQQQIDAARGK